MLKSIFLILFLLISSNVFSTPRVKESGIVFPEYPGGLVADSVYVSCHTCTGLFSMIVSTRPSYLSHINVSSASNAGSWFQVFDARTSTAQESNARLIGIYPADVIADWFFKIGTASGLIVSVEKNNTVGDRPCLDIFHYER